MLRNKLGLGPLPNEGVGNPKRRFGELSLGIPRHKECYWASAPLCTPVMLILLPGESVASNSGRARLPLATNTSVTPLDSQRGMRESALDIVVPLLVQFTIFERQLELESASTQSYSG